MDIKPEVWLVSDILVRDIPDEMLVAVDAHAARLDLSRVEYVRRRLARDGTASAPATVADLRTFADAFADLADPSLMRGAWE